MKNSGMKEYKVTSKIHKLSRHNRNSVLILCLFLLPCACKLRKKYLIVVTKPINAGGSKQDEKFRRRAIEFCSVLFREIVSEFVPFRSIP